MIDYSEETTVGGVRAIELYYRNIRNISTGQTEFYQSRTQLNTPGLGTLMPENFRDLAELTTQCNELFKLELTQALYTCFNFAEKEINFNWISVYMPVKFLYESDIDSFLLEIFDRMEIPYNKICFALADKLLAETDGRAATTIGNLRNRGYHFMLTDFGGDVCPMMRLAGFPVDYVMLSPEVTYYIGKGTRSDNAVQSIIGFVNDMGSEPIADGVLNSKQAEELRSFGCMYCAGSNLGKYVPERSIKKK